MLRYTSSLHELSDSGESLSRGDDCCEARTLRPASRWPRSWSTGTYHVSWLLISGDIKADVKLSSYEQVRLAGGKEAYPESKEVHSAKFEV